VLKRDVKLQLTN